MIKFIVSDESKTIFKIIGLSILFPLMTAIFDIQLAVVILFFSIAIAALTLAHLYVKKKAVANKELHNEHDCLLD